MHIELNNYLSTVVDSTEAERDVLWSYLVIKTPQWLRDFSGRPKYDGEKWEHLFDMHSMTFPAGFTPLVQTRMRAAGFDASVVDRRICPAEADPNADLAWLRDYQLLGTKVATDRTRGIIEAATGAGKTEIIAALMRLYPALRWLIVVHRSGLMRDIAKRIQRRRQDHGLPPEDIGFYGDGEKQLGHRITIATFQTLAANLRDPQVRRMFDGLHGLIVDEAHTLAAEMMTRVVQAIPNAYYRFGVSGTPLARGDKRSMVTVGLLGPVIYRVSAEYLIGRGILARPTVHMVRYDAEEVFSALWNVVRERGVVQSEGRNRAVLSAVKRAQKPCMVFVDILDHGSLLAKGIARAGMNVDFVFGSKDTKQRARALEKLARGDIDVLVTSSIFNEGIDIPSLASVVLAAGGKSVIAMLQRIGRGMRRVEGAKDTFEIWDFEDRHSRILEDHYKARRSAYKKEGHNIVSDVAAVQLALEPSVERVR